jgi:hypothetical protein
MARPRVHAAAAVVALGLIHGRVRWADRLAFWAGSVLVDADHLVDYALRRAGQRQYLVLPLHGWEYVVVLALLPGPAGLSRFARGVALGLLFHLIIDQMTNEPGHPALYSLVYRVYHRFAGERLGFHNGDGSWVHQRWWEWF